MTAFKIETGVPIPKRKKPGRPYKYDFAGMTVGSSAKVKASYATMWTCIKKFCDKPENEGVEFQIDRLSDRLCRIHRVK